MTNKKILMILTEVICLDDSENEVLEKAFFASDSSKTASYAVANFLYNFGNFEEEFNPPEIGEENLYEELIENMVVMLYADGNSIKLNHNMGMFDRSVLDVISDRRLDH